MAAVAAMDDPALPATVASWFRRWLGGDRTQPRFPPFMRPISSGDSGFVFRSWLARVMIQGQHPARLMFVPVLCLCPWTHDGRRRRVALTVGFVLYCDSRWKLLPILACAVLTRETDSAHCGACAYFSSRRRFADLVWAAASALPAIFSTYT